MSNLIGRKATRIRDGFKTVSVILYETEVFHFDKVTRTVTLKTGGFMTPLTQRRMNEASDHYGLGFRVFRMDGEFYVNCLKSWKLPFVNGEAVVKV